MRFFVVILCLGMFVNMYGGEKIDTKKIIYLYNKTDYDVWATSELKEKGYNYSAKNLIDDRLDTVWATRVNGGVGEGLAIFRVGKRMCIINGHGRSRELFIKNNRTKELELKLYRYYIIIVAGATVEAGPPREALLINPLEDETPLIELVVKTNFVLKDEYLYTNKFYLSIDFDKGEKETAERMKRLRVERGIFEKYMGDDYPGYDSVGYVLVLTIKSIYKGSKYNDLCMSEIWFLNEEEEGKTNK